jgi:hypothetical protein
MEPPLVGEGARGWEMAGPLAETRQLWRRCSRAAAVESGSPVMSVVAVSWCYSGNDTQVVFSLGASNFHVQNLRHILIPSLKTYVVFLRSK